MAYDTSNRMTSSTSSSLQGFNEYNPSNKRVYQMQQTWSGSSWTTTSQTYYFYGVKGQKIGSYNATFSGYGIGATITWAQAGIQVFFKGRMIQRTQLSGGFYALTTVQQDLRASIGKYFPYGEEETSPQGPNDQVKFATYTRDSVSGLDYASNRYYGSGTARFSSPDPYQSTKGGSGEPSDPGSWNRYSYTQGNPIQFADPSGLFLVDCVWDGGCYHIGQGFGGGVGSTYGTSMGGTLVASETAAESEYANQVRAAWGWVAGDDPTKILAYANASPQGQALMRIAAGLSTQCQQYLSSKGISVSAVMDAAATATVYQAGDPALASIPFSWFDPGAIPGVMAIVWSGGTSNPATTAIGRGIIIYDPSANLTDPATGYTATIYDVILHEVLHLATGMLDGPLGALFGAQDSATMGMQLDLGGCH
jgi:RHS repeat-associated protein